MFLAPASATTAWRELRRMSRRAKWRDDMKLRVMFKDPDAFSDEMDEALAKEVAHIEDEEEADAIKELRGRNAWAVLREWVEYQEYCMVEFDTIAKTARVVPVKEQGE